MGISIRRVDVPGLLLGMNLLAVLAGLSACSDSNTTTTPGTSPAPSPVPGQVSVSITSPTTAPTYTQNSATLSLGGTASQDGGTIMEVTWQDGRGGSGTASGTASWSITGITLVAGTTTLTVTARGSNNQSATDSIAVTYTPAAPPPDTSRPSVPTNVRATALAFNQVNLTWSASTDNVAVTGYRIERDGAVVGTTNALTFLNTGLSAATSYQYTVSAFDAAGNVSPTSAPAVVTTPAQGNATALRALADSLRPGEWARLETQGYANGDIFLTADNGSILEYSNEAQWDPIGRRIIIAGTGRGSNAAYGVRNQNWVQYSETTNTWTTLPTLPFYLGFHSYDHAAVDTTTGDYYLRVVNSAAPQRYSASSGSWSAMPAIPLSYVGCCNALEFFPELSGLVFVAGASNGATEIFRYVGSANRWERLPTGTNVPMGNYHEITEYNPVQKFLYFGGGEVYQVGNRRELYRLDSNGTVTRLADAPLSYGVQTAMTLVDPLSGNFLLFPASRPTSFYEYDVAANNWACRAIGSTFNTLDQYGDQATVATAIPEYGVLVFFKRGSNNPGVYLYKHARNSPVCP